MYFSGDFADLLNVTKYTFRLLKNQFSRKRISADFNVLWPIRKWKINVQLKNKFSRKKNFSWFHRTLTYQEMKNQIRVAYFLFPFRGKKIRKRVRSFCLFFWRKQKANSEWCSPSSFLWRKQNTKFRLMYSFFLFLNHAFPFHLSEENKTQIQSDAVPLPFSEENKSKFRLMYSFFLFLKETQKEF